MTPEAVLTCAYFDVGQCRSCELMGTPYERALASKNSHAQALLRDVVAADCWLEPAASSFHAFRNKAKLAVGGTTERPTLGLTSPNNHGIDLRECEIHERAIWDVIPDLAGFITLTGLEPYDIARRQGALKFVIVTANSRGDLMVRFVVRQNSDVSVIERYLPALLARLPQVVSVSANVHPEHKAVLEGDFEIHLYGPDLFPFPLPERDLYLHHRSFFQTNTCVAAQLYEQGRQWAEEARAQSVLDLYCGVGGFALHLAKPGRHLVGIEIEPDAIRAAQAGADALGMPGRNISFKIGDATNLGTDAGTFDLVVVNPPRRGLGPDLCAQLVVSGAKNIIYSSCNPATLAVDLSRMTTLPPVSARLFDMFPQTRHSEVAVWLRSTAPE